MHRKMQMAAIYQQVNVGYVLLAPEPKFVLCDICQSDKKTAVHSCLSCRASYCELHIQAHRESEALRRHVLVEPYEELQEKIQLGETLKDLQKRILDNEKTIHLLRETFKRENGLTEHPEQNRAHILIVMLEMETENLKKRGFELIDYSKTRGHYVFVQNFMALPLPLGNGVSPNSIQSAQTSAANFIPDPSSVLQCLRAIKETGYLGNAASPNSTQSAQTSATNFMSDTSSVHQAVRETRYQDMVNNEIRLPPPCPMLSLPEPRTREDFLELSCQLTLDLTTAYENLQVSRDLKKVTHELSQRYPDHPDRFECYEQILCKEALYGGRYYWEVEMSNDKVEFAVAYKTIGRKGWTHDCRFGYNKKSWSLQYKQYPKSSVLHNKNETKISVPSCEIIAVYLDYPAGTLSFYAIANTMTLLHRFETTFTEPLYAGFRLTSFYSSIILC